MNTIELGYDLYCRERFTPASNEQGERFEHLMEGRLPDHYRDFLLNYNGGWFKEPLIDFSESEFDGSDCLQNLNGIGAPSSCNQLEDNYTLLWPASRDMIPIGNTPCGNIFTLAIDANSEEYGDIWYKHARFEVWCYLAESMEMFFSLLNEFPED